MAHIYGIHQWVLPVAAIYEYDRAGTGEATIKKGTAGTGPFRCYPSGTHYSVQSSLLLLAVYFVLTAVYAVLRRAGQRELRELWY